MPEPPTGQCAWCPWDCPAGDATACTTAIEQVPEVIRGVAQRAGTARGILKPRRGPAKDVLRDLADYDPDLQPTAEAVEGP